MAWAKLDDRWADHRKTQLAWQRNPASIGLYAMAITYCAAHETDGRVHGIWIETKMPRRPAREKAVRTLVDVGLFEDRADDFWVHDYLKYNPSHEQLEGKRERDRERKARGGRNGAPAPPLGSAADSARNPDGVRAASESPIPTRPDPTRPSPSGDTLPREGAVSIEMLDALSNAGFDRLMVEQSLGAIGQVLHEFKPPADVDWYATGQQIRRDRESGAMRADRPSSAIKWVAKGIGGYPRKGQVPKGRGASVSPIDHYASMRRGDAA